jgi:hypothetical protein
MGEGNDIFYTTTIRHGLPPFHSSNSVIKDFNEKDDRILIPSYQKIPSLIPKKIEAKVSVEKNTIVYTYNDGIKRRIVLEGVDEERVKEWVDVAKNPQNYDDTEIDENPIKIE